MTKAPQRQAEFSIALIGMRGSGKTTVGRALAKLRDVRHIDTDQCVIEQTGRSIATIFAEEGEAGFRRLEREVMATLSADVPCVISVGGGGVMNNANLAILQRISRIVWLVAPVDVLWQRIRVDAQSPASRPPLTDRTGRSELERLLVQRSPRYDQACEYAIDTTGKSPDEIAEEIIKRISVDG